MSGGLSSLGDGLSRVFLREVMRERRMSTADLAAWLGCAEVEIWNLFSRTDGGGS